MPDPSRANRIGLAWVLLTLALPSCRCDRDKTGAPETGVCERRGTVHLAGAAAASDPSLRLRATHGGCEPCPSELRRGAAPGSPCKAPSVCTDVCCTCPGSKRSFTAAACAQGTCAQGPEACRAALDRFGGALCGE